MSPYWVQDFHDYVILFKLALSSKLGIWTSSNSYQAKMRLGKIIHFHFSWLFANGRIPKVWLKQPFEKGASQARHLSILMKNIGEISWYVLLNVTLDNAKKKTLSRYYEPSYPFRIWIVHMHTHYPSIWMRQLFQISLRSQMYVWKSWINTLHLLLDLMTFNNISSSIFNQEFPVFKKK